MLSVACIGIIEAKVIINVSSLPDKNHIVNTDKFDINSGGGAINAAISISKIGASTAVFGKIGNDLLGGYLLSSLQQARVNTENLIISDNLPTSFSMIFKTPENSFAGAQHKGADTDFSLSDINWTLIENASVIYISGLNNLSKFNNTACEMFLKRCKHVGKITVLDIKTGYADMTAESLYLLKYVDFILIGYAESRAITGSKLYEEISTELAAKGTGACIIRCGVKGVYVKETVSTVGYFLPAYKNIPEVDKTGAGDAFGSGFVYGLSKNMSVRQSALLGNAVGAMCIMEVGATSNIKPYSEIKKFMERTLT